MNPFKVDRRMGSWVLSAPTGNDEASVNRGSRAQSCQDRGGPVWESHGDVLHSDAVSQQHGE
jgi:hypothetical protein